MGVMDYVEIAMKILGGLGAFLLGMNGLSENMTKLAHGKLYSMLNKTSKSRVAGVGIGAAEFFFNDDYGGRACKRGHYDAVSEHCDYYGGERRHNDYRMGRIAEQLRYHYIRFIAYGDRRIYGNVFP